MLLSQFSLFLDTQRFLPFVLVFLWTRLASPLHSDAMVRVHGSYA